MKVITWTCDRCGLSKTAHEGMWDVGIALAKCNKTTTHTNVAPKARAIWCRKCVVAMGLVIPADNEPVPAPYPTIEDMVRDIVTNAIEASQ